MKTVDPSSLSSRAWNRLASISGLKCEDWGAGWLALKREHSLAGVVPENTAIALLKGVANSGEVASNALLGAC